MCARSFLLLDDTPAAHDDDPEIVALLKFDGLSSSTGGGSSSEGGDEADDNSKNIMPHANSADNPGDSGADQIVGRSSSDSSVDKSSAALIEKLAEQSISQELEQETNRIREQQKLQGRRSRVSIFLVHYPSICVPDTDQATTGLPLPAVVILNRPARADLCMS